MDSRFVRRPPDRLDGCQTSEARDGTAASAYAVVCLMCGRTFGHTLDGRFFVQPSGGRLERDGGRLRCGHCHGSIFFEPDPAFSPVPDPAELLASLQRDIRPGRRARHAAG